MVWLGRLGQHYFNSSTETHDYAARESSRQVMAGTVAWLDKYVKNAGVRPAPSR
jgi:hypothetical protein